MREGYNILAKKRLFDNFVSVYKPDIIVGTESRLRPDIQNLLVITKCLDMIERIVMFFLPATNHILGHQIVIWLTWNQYVVCMVNG